MTDRLFQKLFFDIFTEEILTSLKKSHWRWKAR